MTRAYFNQQAHIWDEKIAEKDTAKLERVASCLTIEPGAIIIDIGTGTGVFLPLLLSKVGSNGKVIALDHADKMLLKAKTKNFDGNIGFLCADVMAIPLDNEICDAVVCYSSLPHFPDKLKAMLEMKRILKKGGRVFICHSSGREHINSIHRCIPAMQNDLLPDAIEMMTLLTNAGFTEIRVEDKSDSYFARGIKA
jgi:demethylmenaquinone methyltransferase/2-methoxy-6-polyprenyl-1,4-benzoquinol methylase